MIKKLAVYKVVLAGFFIFLGALPVGAQEYQAEVMTVEGNAYKVTESGERAAIKEGDLISEGDAIETDAAATVDLAFDSEWNNVSRIEPQSNVKLLSIYPTGVRMDRGGIFSQLKALPSKSTFEVQTPSAVASVRGSEYRVTHGDGGTQAYNFSDSPVYVFGMDGAGQMGKEPFILKNSEMTGVGRAGENPRPAERMTDALREEGLRTGGLMKGRVSALKGLGRTGKIQGLDRVRKEYANRMESRLEKKNEGQPGNSAVQSGNNILPKNKRQQIKRIAQGAQGMAEAKARQQEETKGERKRKPRRKPRPQPTQ